jgi:hypothetical protein
VIVLPAKTSPGKTVLTAVKPGLLPLEALAVVTWFMTIAGLLNQKPSGLKALALGVKVVPAG